MLTKTKLSKPQTIWVHLQLHIACSERDFALDLFSKFNLDGRPRQSSCTGKLKCTNTLPEQVLMDRKPIQNVKTAYYCQ